MASFISSIPNPPPRLSSSRACKTSPLPNGCLHTIPFHLQWTKPAHMLFRLPPTGIGTNRSSFAKLGCSTSSPSPRFSAADSDSPLDLEPDVPVKQEQNLFRVASFIGLATAVSKILGLLRETLLAAVFGVGPVVTAFNYSSILPGFFMALLGGVNGPFHITMMATLRKQERKESRSLVEKVSTIVGLVCGILGVALFVFAGPIIDSTAPGLLVQGSRDGLITREIAVLQLKIMAPCALLAGLIGIGFGSLSAAGVYGLPSLSPSLSSISILVAVVVHISRFGFKSAASQNLMAGGTSLAIGATFGALAQWCWQAKAQYDAGLGLLQTRWVNLFEDKDVHEVLAVLLPAILGSGMLQIATFTDLYFASFIPGAAAGLGYANLLVMAPLGILSSAILLPMLSMFANLVEPSHWTELKERVGQGLLLLLAATLPMTAVMVPLSKPIVEVVLQRFAFDAAASVLVSSLVICYVVGSTFYLTRDLLIRVFYALGDGHIPFYISVAAIVANAILDWLLVRVASLGPDGLVLATTLVNIASAIALLILLSERLGGLPFKQWTQSSLVMVMSSLLSAIVTQVSYKRCLSFFSISRSLWMAKFWSILLASGFGISLFYLILFFIAESESSSLLNLLKYRLHGH